MYNRFPRDGQDFLASYQGPYPLYQLMNARDTLVYGFNRHGSKIFHRIYQLMCMDTYSNNFNHEYSEDNYSESESESESKLILNKKIEFNNVPSRAGSGVTTKQESEVKTKGEQLKCVAKSSDTKVKTKGEHLKCVAQSQDTEVSEKPFYSAEGFKNRFAEYLFGKTTVDIFNEEREKSLKRKSPDVEKNGFGVESHNRPLYTNEDFIKLDSDPSSTKVAKTDFDSLFDEDALVQCFKCDYCEFASLQTEEMYFHLNRAKHRSGSKCLGQLENGNVSPWYIVEEMHVRSEEKGVTRIATCPVCFKMFLNIYECAAHTEKCSAASGKQQSGLYTIGEQQSGIYAISEVVRNTEILVPVDSVCQVCRLRCSKHRALNTHYEVCQHYPFDKPQSPNILLSFLCPLCDKDFDDFLMAKAHVIAHAVKYPRVSMALQLFYYRKTLVWKRLLPVRRSLPRKKKFSGKKKARAKKPYQRYFGKFPQKKKKFPISNNK